MSITDAARIAIKAGKRIGLKYLSLGITYDQKIVFTKNGHEAFSSFDWTSIDWEVKK